MPSVIPPQKAGMLKPTSCGDYAGLSSAYERRNVWAASSSCSGSAPAACLHAFFVQRSDHRDLCAAGIHHCVRRAGTVQSVSHLLSPHTAQKAHRRREHNARMEMSGIRVSSTELRRFFPAAMLPAAGNVPQIVRFCLFHPVLRSERTECTRRTERPVSGKMIALQTPFLRSVRPFCSCRQQLSGCI